MLKSAGKSKFWSFQSCWKFSIEISFPFFLLLKKFSLNIFRIEKDAQLLANRIALLKQEEMKTWKKIEETKKRTSEIKDLKHRNEEKLQKVFFVFLN